MRVSKKHIENIQYKNQIRLKIIKGHLKEMLKSIDFCLSRIDKLEKSLINKDPNPE